MAAYLVMVISITDRELYTEYELLARPTVRAHGGKVALRGLNGVTVEGDHQMSRLNIVEFESMEKLKSWYYSPEYQEATALRQRAATGNVIMMEAYQLPPQATGG